MATFIQSGDPGREETPPRLREDLKQRHQRATAADEFRAMLNALGLTPRHAAVGPDGARDGSRFDLFNRDRSDGHEAAHKGDGARDTTGAISPPSEVSRGGSE